MNMHVTDNELQKLINETGYKGCKNCKYQISSLRSCKWSEQGGDGQIHFMCPKWDKTESENTEKLKPCTNYEDGCEE